MILTALPLLADVKGRLRQGMTKTATIDALRIEIRPRYFLISKDPSGAKLTLAST
jgi:hypothetical protein